VGEACHFCNAFDMKAAWYLLIDFFNRFRSSSA
jgi:hypothetical protein